MRMTLNNIDLIVLTFVRHLCAVALNDCFDNESEQFCDDR